MVRARAGSRRTTRSPTASGGAERRTAGGRSRRDRRARGRGPGAHRSPPRRGVGTGAARARPDRPDPHVDPGHVQPLCSRTRASPRPTSWWSTPTRFSATRSPRVDRSSAWWALSIHEDAHRPAEAHDAQGIANRHGAPGQGPGRPPCRRRVAAKTRSIHSRGRSRSTGGPAAASTASSSLRTSSSPRRVTESHTTRGASSSRDPAEVVGDVEAGNSSSSASTGRPW